MTTPNINLTELANGQANYLNANDSFARIDALLQTPVISRTLTAAPGSPANGALYIMGSAWAGIAGSATGRLALWRTGSGWIVITPKEGWRFEVAADEVIYRYDGTAWQSTDAAGFTGGTLESALNEAPAVTLASASTVNIGAAAANTISITGTTDITAFDTIAAGAVRGVIFAASLVLTYNATSMILPTEGDITTVAGDAAEMLSLGGGNWRCIDYQRFSGAALSDGGGVTNPMTAQGDLIVGGVDGAPTRLGSGTALHVLRVNAAGDNLEYAAPSGGGATYSPTVTDSTTARTLAIGDAGDYLRFTNAGASACTVPPQSAVTWLADTEVNIRRAGDETLTLTAGAGVTLNAPAGGTLVMGLAMSVTLKRVASDEWDVIGQTVAV